MWGEEAQAKTGQPGSGNTDQLGDPSRLKFEIALFPLI
jgi:hypothetical protein